MRTFLGDVFSIKWMEDTDRVGEPGGEEGRGEEQKRKGVIERGKKVGKGDGRRGIKEKGRRGRMSREWMKREEMMGKEREAGWCGKTREDLRRRRKKRLSE